MTAARKFPNDAAAARAARQFALEALSGYSSELREVVELLVSELATNSVRHTDSDFEVTISVDASTIRISVADSGTGQPAVQQLDPSAVSGRGLALVEMLSSSWGVRPSQSGVSGKTVWFVLDIADKQLQSGSAARAYGGAHENFAAGDPGGQGDVPPTMSLKPMPLDPTLNSRTHVSRDRHADRVRDNTVLHGAGSTGVRRSRLQRRERVTVARNDRKTIARACHFKQSHERARTADHAQPIRVLARR